jgi:hypothetical protein
MTEEFPDNEINYEIKIIIDGEHFGESILHDSTIESISKNIAEHFNKVRPLTYIAYNIVDDEDIELTYNQESEEE